MQNERSELSRWQKLRLLRSRRGPDFEVAVIESTERYRVTRHRDGAGNMAYHVLGRGGFGRVFLATDELEGRSVAIKCPKTEDWEASDPDLQARYVREVECLRAVMPRDGLCTFHEHFRIENVPFIVMEFIEGKSLERHLRVVGTQTPKEAAELVVRIANAMEAVHERQVIHRDLKPANVLLDIQGNPYVTDFGLGLLMGETRMTNPSGRSGTEGYRSPEQVKGTRRITARTDIYSLGVMLWKMVFGVFPYAAHVEELSKINSIRPSVPAGSHIDQTFVELCLKAIEPFEVDRFSSAGEFARALEAYLRGSDSSSFGAQQGIDQVNARFAGEVQILSKLRTPPRIRQVSILSAEEVQRRTDPPPPINDPHAFLVSTPHWADDRANQVEFEARFTDYVEVCALRGEGSSDLDSSWPRVLSANALLVDETNRQLILQRRRNVRTYPNCLHTFGGGYFPPGIDPARDDKFDLRLTAVRETFEECGIAPRLNPTIPMFVCREVRTNFIQLMLFPDPLQEFDDLLANDNWEGKLHRIGFDELWETMRMREAWVPTGLVHVLLWLQLGAPNCRPGIRFNGLSPIELFDAYLAEMVRG